MPALLLPLLAIAFAAGIGLAPFFGAPRAGWLLAVALLGLALLARPAGRLFLWLLLAAALTGGWASASLALDPPRPACFVGRHTGSEEVRLIGTVLGDPVRLAPGRERQLLRAEALLREGPSLPLCGVVEVQRPPGLPELIPGERVLFRARLRPALGSRNPGAPSSRLRRLSEGIGAMLFASPEGMVRLGPRPPAPLLSRLRARLREALRRGIPEPARRQVVGALVLGETGLDPELRQTYARAGTSHLLAVSGLHLSLVALAALVLIRRGLLRLGCGVTCDPARLAAPAAALVAVGYTLMTGAAPAASRACLMALAGFAGLLLQRPADLARPLALAALLLLAWDPLDLFRASFQLSFLAVIGIALILARRRQTGPPAGPLSRLSRWARDLLLASLAATLLTAPICAHHFHQISLAGVATNLLAVPLLSFAVLPASLIGASLGAVSLELGGPVLALAGWLAAALTRLCQTVASLPGAAQQLPLGWPASLALLAAGLALLLRRGRVRLLALLLAALLAAASAVGWLRLRAAPALELSFLDVGQGDSTLVRFPDGFTMLVDAGGSLKGGDPGLAQVLPFLRGAGLRRLDLVVLSHPHPDHAVGLVSVLRGLPAAELWVCWHDEPDPWLAALLAEAARQQVPVRGPRSFRRGGVLVEPLWPRGAEGHCADRGYHGNDNSLVLRLTLGRSVALLAGDIEEAAERALLERAADPAFGLRADLLKVPHHGSAGSSSSAFLGAVGARLAVLSCGSGNPFGFPRPAALERYAAQRIPLVRTDQLGAIRVRLGAGGELSWSALASPVP